MTVIIDYGVGNLYSLKSSFDYIGEKVIITADKNLIYNADRIILPGVGAFEDAIKKLKDSGLDKTLLDASTKNTPIMGICLGMQLLFDESFEFGRHEGLHLIKGQIEKIPTVDNLKIPHMGWNKLNIVKSHPLFNYIHNEDYVYFVHSYYATNCAENTIATTSYGTTLTASVARKNIMGCQFHPEKSGDVGLNILRAFVKMKGDNI